MKLTALLLLALCLQVQAHSYGQSLTIHEDDAAIQKIFIQITKQTGVQFLYTESIMELAHPVTIHIVNGELENVLKQCFNNQPLEYEMINGTVAIKLKRENMKPGRLDSIPRITGKVTAEGEPLEGVSVRVKNSNKGTLTNQRGEFTLLNVESNSILLFSSVGYLAKEESIDKRTVINVQLSIAVNNLDQTVVIAYGTTTKRFNTGSVNKVTAEQIQQQPVSSPLAALQGRVPGLFITQQTGVQGGAYTVRLRGQNSIVNGNEPLFIIDGVPFSSTPMGSNFNGGSIIPGANPLNSINPNDIESVDVLKDADATAIYGSRGANGVILITTKKGKAGKTKIDITTYAGVGKITRKMDLLNTRQYLDMRYEAFKNDNATPQLYNAPDLLIWDTTKQTDWQEKLIGGTSKNSNAQLSISGGDIHTQFITSIGYNRETTVFPGDFADRKMTVHFNLRHSSSNEKFHLVFSTSYTDDFNNLSRVDMTTYALALSPNAPEVYDESGKLNWPSGFLNPYSSLLQKYKAKSSNLISNAVLSYGILPGLELKSSFGFTKTGLDEMVITPQSSLKPFSSSPPSSSFSNTNRDTWIIEPQLNYHKSVGKSSLTILAGATFQQSLQTSSTITGDGYVSEDLMENIAAATSIYINNNQYNKYRYQAVFGRLNYSWDQKYLLNLTGRRDGSSRFGPGKRFANFGALGMGWIFTEEKWLKDHIPFLSYGKIRASYGVTGNDQIGDYGYLNAYTTTTYPYGSISGLIPIQLFNADYGWESNKKVELALEVGLFKDRLLLTLEYYRNRSSNQLIGFPLPYTTGFSSIKSNLPATVQNKGVELELNIMPVKTSSFRWNSVFNISIPQNKLLSYQDLESSPYSYSYEVGKSLFIKRGFHYTGINEQQGVYTFQDIDGDGMTSFPNDLQSSKELTQDFYGGFSNTFQYKEFTFSCLFQFVKQTGRGVITGFSMPGTLGNQPTEVLDRWQKEGDVSSIQRFSQGYGSPYLAYSNSRSRGDNSIVDASFIRLKNVSVSYQFSGKGIEKLKMDGIKCFVQGQNLLTITDYSGMDPENQSFQSLPPLCNLVAGIQLTF